MFAKKTPGNRPFGITASFEATRDARHAFAVGAGGRVDLFLAWRGRLKVWDGTLPEIPATRGFGVRVEWAGYKRTPGLFPDPAPTLEVNTPIREAFAVWASPGGFYFVTESGQVLHLARRGKQARTEMIWDDPDRPVRVVIHDAGSGRTFAFAPRRPGANWLRKSNVFFALEPKVSPKETEPLPLRPSSPGWQVEAAKQYAAFLLRKGVIKVGAK